MSTKRKSRNRKQQKHYPKEIQAAYFATFRFIAPYDYVIRYTNKHGEKQTCTVNPNCVIAAHKSKGINLFKPFFISQSDYKPHFNRDVILFYKSEPAGNYFTGYGRTDALAQELPFSQELGIYSKKQVDPEYCVLLIVFDIDSHNDEDHVDEVMALIRYYLPNTYWEPSTNGSGRHGYLKIKYRKSFTALRKVRNSIIRLFKALDKLRIRYGYEAEIDTPGGLPHITEFVDENPYHENWTKLYYTVKNTETKQDEDKYLGKYINPKSKIWQGYINQLINNHSRIPQKCRNKPSLLINYLPLKKIKQSFSLYLEQNNISFPAPTKNNKYYDITVQRAIKLPMFGASLDSQGNILPKMECISEFHNLPYYTSSELKKAYSQVKIALNSPELESVDKSGFSVNLSFSETSLGSDINSVTLEELDKLPVPIKGEKKVSSTRSFYSLVTEAETVPDKTVEMRQLSQEQVVSIKEEEKNICNNCACTNTHFLAQKQGLPCKTGSQKLQKPAKEVSWEELNNRKFDTDLFWEQYHQDRTVNVSEYEDVIRELRDEADTFRRTALFIAAYISKIGYVPELDDALAEYVRVGLNRNSALRTQNRINRFKSCLSYYAKNYDRSKKGFNLDWGKARNNVMKKLKPCLPKKLTYKQGQRIKSYTVEDAALVYHIIDAMENSEQNPVLQNSITYEHVDKLFLQELDRKCGRHKLAQILRDLQSPGCIVKTRNYQSGLRGNCYRIVRDDRSEQEEAS